MLQHIQHENARQDKNIWIDREFQALSESIITYFKIYVHSDYILKKRRKVTIFGNCPMRMCSLYSNFFSIYECKKISKYTW